MALNKFGLYPTKNFLLKTSIHGLFHIGSRRFGFAIILLSSAFFCLWQVQRTVSTYLSYDIKIRHSAEDQSSIEFPAITICPHSAYNRLAVGATDKLVLAAYYASKPAILNVEQGRKMCQNDQGEKLNITGDSYPSNYPSFTDFLRYIMPNAGSSVLNCSISGVEVKNCSDYFFNKFTDIGYCFTFNQDRGVINDYPIGVDKASFGSTLPREILLKTAGARGGIQMLILTNQSQYCVPVGQYIAGYVAMVHDKRVEPILFYQKLVDLPPGFSINVGISVSKIERNLEDWPLLKHKCFYQYPLRFYPADQEYKNADNWKKNCLTSKIWSQCGCLPHYIPPLAARVVNQNGNFGGFCSVNDTGELCQGGVEETFLNGLICTSTEERPKPCRETKYRIFTTASAFPSKNLFISIKREANVNPNMTLEEFRQNFLMANFFITSSSIGLITSDPALTWIDLMNQMGGALGMSLGVSLLSFGEIVGWLTLQLISIRSWFKQFKINRHTYIS